MKEAGVCYIEGKRERCGQVQKMKKKGTCGRLWTLLKEERWLLKITVVM